MIFSFSQNSRFAKAIDSNLPEFLTHGSDIYIYKNLYLNVDMGTNFY